MSQMEYNLPQGSGMTHNTAVYGPLQVGSWVVIHKHRPVNGDNNWIPSMDAYYGRVGIIHELSGIDKQGCPCAKCTFDGNKVSYSFRIRDMTLLDVAGNRQADIYNLPQDKGIKKGSGTFGKLQIGSRVIIHKHRPVIGESNWVPPMDFFIGKEGVVTEFADVDCRGCPIVKCSFRGIPVPWVFRIRDLTLIS